MSTKTERNNKIFCSFFSFRKIFFYNRNIICFSTHARRNKYSRCEVSLRRGFKDISVCTKPDCITLPLPFGKLYLLSKGRHGHYEVLERIRKTLTNIPHISYVFSNFQVVDLGNILKIGKMPY